MRWEYRIMEALEGDNVRDLLNEAGNMGWGLAFCDLDKNVFIFKRPISTVVQSKSKDTNALEGYFGVKVD